MPTYVYETISENESECVQFEVEQSMRDQPLKVHPENGLPVRRVLQAPNLALKWSDVAAKNKLSDRNLDRIGMTKYVKAGDGTYEKRSGAGPDLISSD